MRATIGTITRGVLVDQRGSLAAWAVAIAAVSAMYTAFYPTIGAGAMEDMLDTMPAELTSAMGFDAIASASGYVTSTVYSLVGIILLLVYGIAQGAKVIAGQEESGILELELTSPVTRTRTYTERLIALWLGLLAPVAAVSLSVMTLNATLPLDISNTNILSTGALMWLTGGLFATLALATGAATGRKAIGLALGAGAAVVLYVSNALGPVAGLAWMTAISPFDWYLGTDPLAAGMDWAGAALLIGCSTLIAAGGLFGFRRRNLMV
jgi:ABC-2 type transport system permease protein